ncbi:Integrase zinc binding domain [Popillia japonica]|uniref:RNA-directed DNA polymerase n=1 Tax=Popillia japonica TaxID=7064 RepID=A0AAW1M376_POPJA
MTKDDVGHVGLDKVTELISRTYWFPKLHDKVKSYIANCVKCIVYSKPSGKKEGILYNIPKGDVPFVALHIDHLGPFEATPRKHKYIFEVIDGFSKFIKLFPCKTTNTVEVIKHLKNYFNNYSQPFRIISDRGSCFTSKEFEQFVQERGIQHIKVATGTPKANGQIERSNRDIVPMIGKLCPDTNQWDTVIDQLEYALNNTTNRSTGKTPSILTFGIEQRGRITDAIRPFLESLNSHPRDLVSIRHEAAMKIIKEQEYNKGKYDQKHKPPKVYKNGDFVMIVNTDVTPGVNKKLLPKYRGPYKIDKVLGNDRYLISDIEGFQLTRIPFSGIYESSRMRPWLGHCGTNLNLNTDTCIDNS